MIYDHKQSTLDATVDDSSIEATVSVSLGLIVTQLVINALKHAFPGRHQGKILVDYRSEGGNWTLSGSDNGVGVAANATTAKPGLGTSIVEALANRLEAEIQISSAKSGNHNFGHTLRHHRRQQREQRAGGSGRTAPSQPSFAINAWAAAGLRTFAPEMK
ncbi:MAG: Signal transduction histidine kinase [Rhodospirillales bacterium]|nr:Signal transduction histidine kinase [Rhodospirillales bacterium]